MAEIPTGSLVEAGHHAKGLVKSLLRTGENFFTGLPGMLNLADQKVTGYVAEHGNGSYRAAAKHFARTKPVTTLAIGGGTVAAVTGSVVAGASVIGENAQRARQNREYALSR